MKHLASMFETLFVLIFALVIILFTTPVGLVGLLLITSFLWNK